MPKIVKLKIKNFRGIKDLNIDFSDENIVCFIGRRDSGKSTILEAISCVLSSSWNLTFHDTDFYNCDINSSIEIEASVIGIPEKLISDEKYGLHIRLFDVESRRVHDDIFSIESDKSLPMLTIKLAIDKSLEPVWTVTNARDQEDKQISASDRTLLNCSMVSDHIDRHFYWNRGNPLFGLLRGLGDSKVADQNSVVIDSLRQAKKKIDEFDFKELDEVTQIIKSQAALLGLNIAETRTTLDFKDISIKDGKISLHEDAIPLMNKNTTCRKTG